MSRKCSVEPSRHRGKFHGDSAKTKLSGDIAPGPCHCVPSLPVAEIPLGDGTKGLARTSRNASLQRNTSSEESDGVSLNRPVLSGLTNTTMLIDPFLFPNPGLWDALTQVPCRHGRAVFPMEPGRSHLSDTAPARRVNLSQAGVAADLQAPGGHTPSDGFP